LGEERADKALEGLAHRRVWDAALVLVELPAATGARRHQRLVQLVTTADLPMPEYPDTSTSSCALGHNSVESRNQRLNLALRP